ncbi:MAG: hypothetical protein ACRCYU_02125 [Nocardioides sp.]
MTSRAEVTTEYAKAYAKASKKGQILDQVVEVTGWSRDNARRRLAAAAARPPGVGRTVAQMPRKQRAPKYSYDALKVLQRVRLLLPLRHRSGTSRAEPALAAGQ